MFTYPRKRDSSIPQRVKSEKRRTWPAAVSHSRKPISSVGQLESGDLEVRGSSKGPIEVAIDREDGDAPRSDVHDVDAAPLIDARIHRHLKLGRALASSPEGPSPLPLRAEQGDPGLARVSKDNPAVGSH